MASNRQCPSENSAESDNSTSMTAMSLSSIDSDDGVVPAASFPLRQLRRMSSTLPHRDSPKPRARRSNSFVEPRQVLRKKILTATHASDDDAYNSSFSSDVCPAIFPESAPSAHPRAFRDTRGLVNHFSSLLRSVQFRCVKTNKYGRRQERILELDQVAQEIRVLDASMRLRKLLPASKIYAIEPVAEIGASGGTIGRKKSNSSSKSKAVSTTDSTRSRLFFAGNQRPYDLQFETAQRRREFDALAQQMKVAISRKDQLAVNKPRGMGLSLLHAHTDSGRHDEAVSGYLQYEVFKENKYGLKQFRILVLDLSDAVLRVLDGKRRIKKHMSVMDLKAIDVKASKGASSAARSATLVFSSDQRPFMTHFNDSCELLDFRDQVCSINPNVVVHLDEAVRAHDDMLLRFPVVKVHRLVKKERILYLDIQNAMLHLVVQGKKRKDIACSRIEKIQRVVNNKRKLTIQLHDDPKSKQLTFASMEARELFYCEVRALGRLNQYPTESPVGTIGRNTSTYGRKSNVGIGKSSPVKHSLVVGSWNVGSMSTSTARIDKFLPKNKDIYVVGLQECKKRDAWVQHLLLAISDADLEKVKVPLSGHMSEPASQSFVVDGQGEAVSGGSAEAGGYSILALHSMWEIVIVVFIRTSLVPLVTSIAADSEPTGVGDLFGNKGGVGIAFQFEDTSFCFVCCHLAARQERLEQRRENYVKIVRGLRQLVPKIKGVDVLHHFHHLIWFGDLNYRVEKDFDSVCELVDLGRLQELQLYDQLTSEMASNAVFVGFEEGELDFPPTYRMERNVQAYNNKRHQSPSWTDRILFSSLPGCEDEMRQTSYTSCEEALGSDHRPVTSSFEFLPRIHHEVTDEKILENAVIEFPFLTYEPLDSAAAMASTVRIHFSSTTLEDMLNSRPGIFHKLDSAKVRWTWSGANLPLLHPFIKSLDHLVMSHVHIMVVETSDNSPAKTLGTSVVSLRHIFTKLGKSDRFSLVVTKDGAMVGRIKGEMIGRQETR